MQICVDEQKLMTDRLLGIAIGGFETAATVVAPVALAFVGGAVISAVNPSSSV